MGKTLEANPIQPYLPRVEEHCSYHDSKGHHTVHCKHLQRCLKELVYQGFLKEYVLITRAASNAGQLNALSPIQ